MEQLLTTKLYIPQLNVDLVSRPRLYECLDEGLERKLTLISAPTGFGKSTLVTGWVSERDQPVAWLSLDQGDNDPVRFWSYLIAAIQTIHPEVGVEARQIAIAPQLRSNESVVVSLINDISQLACDLIIVLDDYHVIEAGQVHSGLGYLLEYQPPNLHIILITRVDPSISLARLRVHNQLIEIRAENLQFSIDEATSLFNEKMDLTLKPEQIEALKYTYRELGCWFTTGCLILERTAFLRCIHRRVHRGTSVHSGLPDRRSPDYAARCAAWIPPAHLNFGEILWQVMPGSHR